MPEGPEVKIFIDNLNQNFRHYQIKSIKVLSGRYIKKPILKLKNLVDKKIKSFNCKGKFIWFDLDDIVVFNTLGMTGSWSRTKKNHSRIEIKFYENDTLYFNDIRNFGTFQIKDKEELFKKLKSLGPDMLSSPPNSSQFISLLRKKSNKDICSVLMNQNVISGVGNYIKAEVLWLSKVSPLRTVNSLTDEEVISLRDNIQSVIRTSFQNGGATIKSFYGADGSKGTYSSKFLVYNQKLDPYNNNVVKTKTPDGRTTHWVPEIQK